MEFELFVYLKPTRMITTAEGQDPKPTAVFTPKELQDFLDELYCYYLVHPDYDGWTGDMRIKHYLMIRHLQQGITN